MANGNSNNGVGEWIVLGALAVGVAGGTALTDVDPALVTHNSILGNTEDSFDAAKDDLYGTVERDPATNSIRCVYSNTVVSLVQQNGTFRPDTNAGVDAEHTWASEANWVGDEYHFLRDSIPGADLHNLYPARKGINRSRGNHPFGTLPVNARQLFVDDDGTLGDETATPSGSFRDPNADGVVVFQPRPDHRGNVARAMFYMSVRYWMPIPDDMESVLRDWHVEDPVDQREETRNNRIQNIQDNRNPFVDDSGLVDQVVDF